MVGRTRSREEFWLGGATRTSRTSARETVAPLYIETSREGREGWSYTDFAREVTTAWTRVDEMLNPYKNNVIMFSLGTARLLGQVVADGETPSPRHPWRDWLPWSTVWGCFYPCTGRFPGIREAPAPDWFARGGVCHALRLYTLVLLEPASGRSTTGCRLSV